MCVCVCVVQVNALLAVPPEETADRPPATVIYSLRTSAVAHPSDSVRRLSYDWLFLCGKKIPFYLIKWGAWQTPLSTLCLAASIHLTPEENYDLVNSCMPPSSTAKHLYYSFKGIYILFDTIFRLLFITLAGRCYPVAV